MKLSCFSKILLLSLLAVSSLFAGLSDKSAMLYYGKNISYPMVGIHDYIIVQPENINTHTHGFDVYQDKIYAYVSIVEIDTSTQAFKKIDKSWIKTQNSAWKSKVLDITNKDYHAFIFKELIEPRLKQGFKHFFFDTLDSYHLYCKTKEERLRAKKSLSFFINTFHHNYPDAKLIVNRGFELIDTIHSSVEAVLFESYVYGLSGNDLHYKEVSKSDQEWLDLQINKMKEYKLNIIAVDYLDETMMSKSDKAIAIIKAKGMIPYITDKELLSYGRSSKNALKREVLVLIDAKKQKVPSSQGHKYLSLPLEYLGYVPRLHDINKGLPSLAQMQAYAGVIVWGDEKYKSPESLYKWIIKLHAKGIKTLILDNFSGALKQNALQTLGIELIPRHEDIFEKLNIVQKDVLLDFEASAQISGHHVLFHPQNAKALLTYENEQGSYSVPAALTPWGAYAYKQSAMRSVPMAEPLVWVVNPFEFFQKALSLKNLLIPDTTTENGNRLIFATLDHNGSVQKTQWNNRSFASEAIDKEILKRYRLPHTVTGLENTGKLKDDLLQREYIRRANVLAKYKLIKKKFEAKPLSNTQAWVSSIPPLGLEKDGLFEVYEAGLNEDVYTNGFTSPLWGYKKAIQGFELSDLPRRLKPIHINYSFYSGAKRASLNALKSVFDWSDKEKTFPIYASDYVKKAKDFTTVSIGNEGETWLVEGMKNLRTLRWDESNISIKLKETHSVLGFSKHGSNTYIHLNSEKKHYLVLNHKSTLESKPYLMYSNARMCMFETDDEHMRYAVRGNTNIKLALHLPKACTVRVKPRADILKHKGREVVIGFKQTKKAEIYVQCN